MDGILGFAVAVVISGVFLRSIPLCIRRFVAWPFLFANRKHFNKVSKHLIPLIKQRQADLTKAQNDEKAASEEPVDLLQWNIQNSMKHPDPREWDPVLITKRTMATNFAAMHTTSITTAHILLDLASSPPELGVLEDLREEIGRVYAESGGVWTKASVAKLFRLDSVIRESLRMSPLGLFGLVRKVIAKGGVVTSDGLHLPEGAIVAVNNYGEQVLHERHENAADFDAFRFSRSRESLANTALAQNSGEHEIPSIVEEKKMASTSTGIALLNFGHGKHACPGRFFAVQEIKLLLAHILLDFEIHYVKERPQNQFLGTSCLPPAKATLRIRKLGLRP